MTETAMLTTAPRVVKVIPATINIAEEVKNAHKQLRVAAYCRVSTKQEEQLNSYEVQRNYYTEKINSEPKWTLVDIYADEAVIIGLKPPSTNGRRFSPISITGHFPI